MVHCIPHTSCVSRWLRKRSCIREVMSSAAQWRMHIAHRALLTSSAELAREGFRNQASCKITSSVRLISSIRGWWQVCRYGYDSESIHELIRNEWFPACYELIRTNIFRSRLSEELIWINAWEKSLSRELNWFIFIPGEATWFVGRIKHHCNGTKHHSNGLSFEKVIWAQIESNQFLACVQLKSLIMNRLKIVCFFSLEPLVESIQFLRNSLESCIEINQFLGRVSYVISWFDSKLSQCELIQFKCGWVVSRSVRVNENDISSIKW